jgi:hypothetical protein
MERGPGGEEEKSLSSANNLLKQKFNTPKE